MLRSIRDFFFERDVIEVQTACLASRAVTDPAIASLAVPGMGYLQTSPEYQLKRLLAAGAPSLYQLGPVFRGGEAGRLHNPEFTMLEWYRLGYTDAELMAEVAELVDRVLGVGDYEMLGYDEVVALGEEEEPPADRADLDLAFSKGVEALAGRRAFVVDYPADQAILARLRPERPAVAARFELCVDGVELANGYWELGERAAIERRFAEDLAERRRSGSELPRPDGAFLAAMDAGLPDCAGVALGIDRLLMIKLGASSLAEVMAFPTDRA
ncbi:MAG: EF-P lysine aminoacylase GenX [Pseudomonadales bacterium]|nr:EF-P lysine aminoacylase GenX [Pseudomonadales bacterium]NIX07108.1 EF-P lysine aminoacylase GenX [Pseudomonadales bacterium]